MNGLSRRMVRLGLHLKNHFDLRLETQPHGKCGTGGKLGGCCRGPAGSGGQRQDRLSGEAAVERESSWEGPVVMRE